MVSKLLTVTQEVHPVSPVISAVLQYYSWCLLRVGFFAGIAPGSVFWGLCHNDSIPLTFGSTASGRILIQQNVLPRVRKEVFKLCSELTKSSFLLQSL